MQARAPSAASPLAVWGCRVLVGVQAKPLRSQQHPQPLPSAVGLSPGLSPALSPAPLAPIPPLYNGSRTATRVLWPWGPWGTGCCDRDPISASGVRGLGSGTVDQPSRSTVAMQRGGLGWCLANNSILAPAGVGTWPQHGEQPQCN